jgi:hypothetical protein
MQTVPGYIPLVGDDGKKLIGWRKLADANTWAAYVSVVARSGCFSFHAVR